MGDGEGCRHRATLRNHNAARILQTELAMSQSSTETLLARSIVQLAGRDPTAFYAGLSGASVHVSGPLAAARYPQERWRDLFMAHLHAGFYDIRPARAPTGGST